ncbi:MAG: TadE/TadG family type IV pilus assembly protein [Gaiellales bacterium]
MISRWFERKRLSDTSGQALVESALVMPILLLVVFGIIQFGITFNHYLTLTDAVRAGSRQGAVSRLAPNPAQAAIDRVRSAASGSLDTSPEKLVVTVTFKDLGGGGQPVQGGDITVKATYPYEINLLGLVVKSGTLTSETTERVE